MAIKPRIDDRMAKLRGRTWQGEDAVEYLYNRLTGEDGETPWAVADAAKRVTGKLRSRITEQTISKWLKKEHLRRRARENFEMVQKATLDFLAENSKSDLDLDKMVDVQLVMMIGRIHSEDGAEEAIKAMNAFTGLKKAMIDERKLKQRATEWEERTEKLRAELEALRAKINKPGGGNDPGKHIDQVIGLVDKVMGLAR